MIKYILILGLAFGLTMQAKAQIPNGDFENWSGNDPLNWVTTNGLALLSNPLSVFNSTHSHSGAGACEMHAVHILNKPSGVFVPDYAGSIFIGKQIGYNSIRGFSYTYRPAQLEFWNTYTGSTGDSAAALVLLTHWNSSTSKADTIAFGFFFRSTFDTVYSKATIPLTYLSTANPDTAILTFAAVSIFGTKAGAVFTIDDLAFTGGNVGVPESVASSSIAIYPNPVHGQLTVETGNEYGEGRVTISDMQGKRWIEKSIDLSTRFSLDLSALKSGVYLLSIANDKTEKHVKISVE